MDIKTEKHAVHTASAKRNAGSLIPDRKLRQLYAAMLECRVLEKRAALPATQRRRGPGDTAAHGYEAAMAGCTVDLLKEDVIVSARHAAWNVPGKSSAKLAAVVEQASRLKKTGNLVVAFSATGSISDRILHELLSDAGSRSLPIIFVRLNKLSEPTANTRTENARLSGESLYGRLRADCGFPCIPVDGHDVVAVYRVAYESIQRARRGGGPTLIHCEPYVPDSPRRKRHPEEWGTERDPIRHMELYLSRKGLFRNSWKNRLVEEFSRKLDAAIDATPQE